jgi:hypothetical protein
MSNREKKEIGGNRERVCTKMLNREAMIKTEDGRKKGR